MSNFPRAAAFFVLVLLAQGAGADSAAQRLRAYFAELRSLSGEFQQTLYDENMRRLEQSSGTVHLRRPGQFRWEYTAPYAQLIVADGEKIWIYDEELAQVTIRALDEALGDSPALLLTSQSPPDEAFYVRDMGAGTDLDWVELTPRREEATFSSVRLGFGDHDLGAMELTDKFGQTTQLRFSRLRKNHEIGPAVFSFTPPEGVDVVGELPPESVDGAPPP